MRPLLAALALTLSATQAYEPVVVTQLLSHEIPAPVERLEYPSFSRALQNLDFRPLDRGDIAADPLTFGRSLEQIADGRADLAEPRLAALSGSSTRGLAAVATRLRHRLLFDAGQYVRLRDLMLAGAGVEPAVEQLARLPEETLSELQEAAGDRLWMAPSNVPIIQVIAAGVEQGFAFDTGAAFTVLREGLAEELGVRISETSISVDTSTDIRLQARYGVLSELRLGHVRILDHTVLVLKDRALEFEMVDGTRFSIDGIVGWNAIRHLRAELDYPGGGYRASLSRPRDDEARNLFWLGYPLVRLTAADGQVLLFGLDTGSRNTSITGNIFDKVRFGWVEKRQETIGGAGGARRVVTDVADRLALVITGHRFEISLPRREDSAAAAFVTIDGVLGSDVARRCRLVIDASNAYFGLELADRS